jgi:hypothetical protein
MPLTQTFVTLMPFRPQYVRFSLLEALTCGTGHVKCPFYFVSLQSGSHLSTFSMFYYFFILSALPPYRARRPPPHTSPPAGRARPAHAPRQPGSWARGPLRRRHPRSPDADDPLRMRRHRSLSVGARADSTPEKACARARPWLSSLLAGAPARRRGAMSARQESRGTPSLLQSGRSSPFLRRGSRGIPTSSRPAAATPRRRPISFPPAAVARADPGRVAVSRLAYPSV